MQSFRNQLLPLTGHFNQLDVCWKKNTAVWIEKQSRGFLECIKGNFLIKLFHTPTGEDQTWLLTSSPELVKEVQIGGILGCRNCDLVDLLMILRNRDLANSKIRTQNFKPRLLEQRSSSSSCLKSKTRQARTLYG